MTDTTHTPGPWLVADTTVYSLQSDGHVLVNRFSAHVQTGVGRDAQRTPPAELEANALLMAAAPDMLAALRDAALQIEYLHEKFQETGSGNAVLFTINAAIARATGGAA